MLKSLCLEGENLTIAGATKIVSSTATQVVAETGENSIILQGSDIEVKRLNLEEGEILLSGKFSSIKFGESAAKKSLLKKIFK